MKHLHHKNINKIISIILGFLFLLLATLTVLYQLDEKHIILSTLLIIIGVCLLVFPFAKHQDKKSHTFNPQILTALGIIWTTTGIVINNPGLRAPGGAFLILGLAQRKKRKHKHRSKFSHKHQQLIMILLIFGVAILTLMLLYFFLG